MGGKPRTDERACGRIFFFNLFSSKAGYNITEILQVVPTKVDNSMNNVLCAEYSPEEVKTALENTGDLKVPGPDGMPVIFFKRFWQIVGDQLTREVLNV